MMRPSLIFKGIAAVGFCSGGFLLGVLLLPGQTISFSRSAAISEIPAGRDPLSGWTISYYGVANPKPGPGLPLHLMIPSIHVDAAVVSVGATPQGSMDVPKNRDEVGWFMLGRRPGEQGSAVIAGHYGRQFGKGSVFDDLHKLRVGDVVYVDDDTGIRSSFVVTSLRRFDPDAETASIFGSIDDESHLNLVTCEGVWDERTQQYTKRLVVFTDKLTE